jgi:hypothetical protein
MLFPWLFKDDVSAEEVGRFEGYLMALFNNVGLFISTYNAV